jgi:hypothetical protein
MRMIDRKRREDLARRVEERRRELLNRPDISQRTRELSQSSSRNPILTPRKRSTTRNFIIGGIAVGLMLLFVILGTGAIIGNLWFQNELNDPTTVVQQFYTSLHQQDYTHAYSFLSKSAQTSLPSSDFDDKYGSYDRVEGIVDTFTVTKADVGATTATFTVAVQRRGDPNTAKLETVRLSKAGSDWHIDSIVIGGTIPSTTPTS